jgi:hypothetical protein
MKLPDSLNRMFRVPKLTWPRIILALAVALLDQAIDCVAMALTSWLIGFHWLLLPTFVLELVPVLEDLPTWTACTIAVIALRKRGQRDAGKSSG